MLSRGSCRLYIRFSVVGRILIWGSAGFLAAGLVASQLLLGGWFYPALAAPGYLLVAVAALLAGAVFWKTADAPGAFCVGTTLLFAGYLFWRQSAGPDFYAAREDTWSLLAALSVYLAVAWQLRGDGPRWLVLGTVAVLVVAQVAIVTAQFAAASPFHPLAELALRLRLPHGSEGLVNRGFVTGTLDSKGSLSAVLQVMTFLILGVLVWGRGGAVVKMLLLWATAAGFAGLLLSLSRSAYLGMAAGTATFALVSFFILNRGAAERRVALGLAALLLVVLPLVAAVYVGSESILVRFRMGEVGGDAYREALWWRCVPPMLGLDPWFGTGANMFDHLSLRYRGGALEGRAVHAHNDWLQLLVEYGRAGLALGATVFLVHFFAAWKSALRLAREAKFSGLLPQNMSLGLASGALAAWTAQAVHSFFDFRLHIPAVVLLVALCGGLMAAARSDSEDRSARTVPWWLRCVALMPLLPGAVLLWWVLRDAPAERSALRAENAILRADLAEASRQLAEGTTSDPDNPRLLALSAECARRELGNLTLERTASGPQAERWVGDAGRFVFLRPYSSEGMRAYGLALTHNGRFGEALPFLLRGIALEPDAAAGYEFLGHYYLRKKQYAEALRLYRLARCFPGSSVTPQEIEAWDQYLRGSGS